MRRLFILVSIIFLVLSCVNKVHDSQGKEVLNSEFKFALPENAVYIRTDGYDYDYFKLGKRYYARFGQNKRSSYYTVFEVDEKVATNKSE